MPYGQITADKITNSDGFTLGGDGAAMKNRIINGAMVIDQRNAGANTTVSSSRNYYLDRFSVFAQTGSKLSIQQNAGSVTPPAGFTNYAGIVVTSAVSLAAGDQYMFEQQIEGYNIADFNWGSANAKTVTLSFWIYSSRTGTFAGVLSNSGENRTYPFTYVINLANTWEYKTITVSGDTSGTWLTTNGVGLRLKLNLGTGSTYSGTAGAWTSTAYISSVSGTVNLIDTVASTWYITGVQLEVGSTATSFDVRPYGTELALCQRYYEVHGGTASCFPQYFGYGANGTNVGLAIPFAVTKRSAATVTALGTWTVSNCGQPAADSATTQGYRLYATCSGTNTIQFYPASSSEKVTISAEL